MQDLKFGLPPVVENAFRILRRGDADSAAKVQSIYGMYHQLISSGLTEQFGFETPRWRREGIDWDPFIHIDWFQHQMGKTQKHIDISSITTGGQNPEWTAGVGSLGNPLGNLIIARYCEEHHCWLDAHRSWMAVFLGSFVGHLVALG